MEFEVTKFGVNHDSPDRGNLEFVVNICIQGVLQEKLIYSGVF